MATIRQRENGGWQAIVRRLGQKKQYKTFNKKSDAVSWARDVENKIDRGIFSDRSVAEQTSLGNLIDRFRSEFAPFHYRARDDKKEAWRFQLDRLNEELGDYSLAMLDQQIVAKYRDSRIQGTKLRPPVSESTARKELFLLSAVLNFAQTECNINLPRGNVVGKIRMPAEGRGRDRRLNNSEMNSLESECRASRNIYLWPIVELAIETAARQGELLSLQWENINLERRLVCFPLTKNGEARYVPLSPRAIEIFKNMGVREEGGVFNFGRMTLASAFRDAVKRAAIADFTFHDLRHESLSRFAERGDFSLLEMAAVSGHKTLQMLKRYTHLQNEKLADKLAKSPA